MRSVHRHALSKTSLYRLLQMFVIAHAEDPARACQQRDFIASLKHAMFASAWLTSGIFVTLLSMNPVQHHFI